MTEQERYGEGESVAAGTTSDPVLRALKELSELLRGAGRTYRLLSISAI